MHMSVTTPQAHTRQSLVEIGIRWTRDLIRQVLSEYSEIDDASLSVMLSDTVNSSICTEESGGRCSQYRVFGSTRRLPVISVDPVAPPVVSNKSTLAGSRRHPR